MATPHAADEAGIRQRIVHDQVSVPIDVQSRSALMDLQP